LPALLSERDEVIKGAVGVVLVLSEAVLVIVIVFRSSA
jgi:hypothetical protein